jgi:hypothetical protein
MFVLKQVRLSSLIRVINSLVLFLIIGAMTTQNMSNSLKEAWTEEAIEYIPVSSLQIFSRLLWNVFLLKDSRDQTGLSL